MVDAGIRLLSLANQLNAFGRPVTLDFEEGEEGAMGYLNRMGFFDHLASTVQVCPNKPLLSTAKVYGGTNQDLVEFASINPRSRDQDLPTRLSRAVMHALPDKVDATLFEGAVWTVFAELINNIYDHSATKLDGYAGLQYYKKSNNLLVVVSDSGDGIMGTLRPVIKTQFPALARLSDVDLLVEIFRQGISRHGIARGCGLKGSADKAIKFKADLAVRLPESSVHLVPAGTAYGPNLAYCEVGLPLICGTHISFTFHLDKLLKL